MTEPKPLSARRLARIAEDHGDMPVVELLLGHIAHLDGELARKQRYYDEFLVPKLLEDQDEERAGWRKRLENEQRRVNPVGLEPGL